MLLNFEDGRQFAQGACSFVYRPATERETKHRIFVPVQIESIQTEAVVDTGGVYLVCHPEIADLLRLDLADKVGTDELNIRGSKIPGSLYRLYLTLLAEEGKPLTLQVSAFVPRLEPYETWDLPSFMGLTGCLEWIRFAVDPITETFYFSAIYEGI
jgi:hypothetical protein